MRWGKEFLRHGSEHSYDKYGCRCSLCKIAKSLRNAKRYGRRASSSGKTVASQATNAVSITAARSKLQAKNIPGEGDL